MALYNEERQGQSPTVRGTGGGNLLVDWQQQPDAFQDTSKVLGTILSTIEQEETKKMKKTQEKFDLYKTLREAGYDTKAAYEAMASGSMPAGVPSETVKEKKDKADLANTEADARLKTSKADAYDRGDIGKRQSAAEKMNAAQLQREIKRVSDPFENPDYDSDETKSYLSYLNSRLQQMSQYPGSQPPAGEEPAAAAPAPGGKKPALGKIRVKRLADGTIGTISAKNFDPKKYERA